MNWNKIRFWFWLMLLVLSPIAIVGGGYVYATTQHAIALFMALVAIPALSASYQYFTEPL